MNLNKEQSKLHDQALEILQQDVLNEDEKFFVFENYQESGTNLNKLTGAFFTPFEMAKDMAAIEVLFDRKVVDLCAGIGMLSFALIRSAMYEDYTPQITCIEINPEYVEIGKKLVPEATWICGNVLNDELINSLGKFQQAVSNPPFGNIKTADLRTKPQYTGPDFEFKVIEQASRIASYGTFILPQMSSPFLYSLPRREKSKQGPSGSAKWKRFADQTGWGYDETKGLNTMLYADFWKTKVPTTEFVSIDFTEPINQ